MKNQNPFDMEHVSPLLQKELFLINGGTQEAKEFEGKSPIHRLGQLVGVTLGGIFVAFREYYKAIDGNTAYASPVGR